VTGNLLSQNDRALQGHNGLWPAERLCRFMGSRPSEAFFRGLKDCRHISLDGDALRLGVAFAFEEQVAKLRSAQRPTVFARRGR
jgi:hypothetical protein